MCWRYVATWDAAFVLGSHVACGHPIQHSGEIWNACGNLKNVGNFMCSFPKCGLPRWIRW